MWSEYLFILKPSKFEGVGVFATQDIPAGTVLFKNEIEQARTLKIEEVPQEFLRYCIYINDQECIAPARFDHMEIDWYLNHSDTPNMAITEDVEENSDIIKTVFRALTDIKADEEILIDYNDLNEPEHLKDEYYKR